LWSGLKVAWPILSGLLGTMAMLGVAVARLESWTWPEGLYFAFISGLTIGYGDLVPKRAISRFLAVAIGIVGVLLVALVAAIAVRALNAVQSQDPER
jgi:hypothetical protein